MPNTSDLENKILRGRDGRLYVVHTSTVSQPVPSVLWRAWRVTDFGQRSMYTEPLTEGDLVQLSLHARPANRQIQWTGIGPKAMAFVYTIGDATIIGERVIPRPEVAPGAIVEWSAIDCRYRSLDLNKRGRWKLHKIPAKALKWPEF